MNEYDLNIERSSDANEQSVNVHTNDSRTEELLAKGYKFDPDTGRPLKPGYTYRPASSNNGQQSYRNAEGSYGYNTPSVRSNPSGSQITYVPAQQRSQAASSKTTKKKGVSLGAVVAVCIVAVILSGLFAFGGTYIANSLSSGSSRTGYKTSSVQTGNTATVTTDPVVIYRSVSTENDAGSSGMSFKDVSAMVKDSVVEIATEVTIQYFRHQYVSQGAGSGVIISENGYILTNAHVITNDSDKAADSIAVRLTDGSVYDATVVGFDVESDIALIKIDASGLTPAVLGSSDSVILGEEVIAVGNPLGTLGGTVTNGIISSTERVITINGDDMTVLQTNAEISPGNSGGGLFNMNGELIGIVNAKAKADGVEGIGFAIPVDNAMSIVEQLMEYGYVRGKVYLGVDFEDVDSSYSYFFYNITPGVYVSAVTSGYNDDVLKSGDRVISVNDTAVSTYAEIKSIINSSSVGDTLVFQVERNGKVMTVNVQCFELIPEGITDGVSFGK